MRQSMSSPFVALLTSAAKFTTTLAPAMAAKVEGANGANKSSSISAAITASPALKSNREFNGNIWFPQVINESTSYPDVHQRYWSRAITHLGTAPNTHPHEIATAQSYNRPPSLNGAPTNTSISHCAEASAIAQIASLTPLCNDCERNKSPHVQPVSDNRGKTATLTFSSHKLLHWLIICSALNLQSATLTLGVTAATLKNPVDMML